MSEHAELELVHALADGELSDADAAKIRAHLATCEECQAELADVMQFAAMPAPAPVAKVISLAWYRRRTVQIAAGGLAIAAGVALWLATREHHAEPIHETPATQIALAGKRKLEARVAWGVAADYRDYDVPRGSEQAHEQISLATLAEVEKGGDVHGVGVLALLDGDAAQAKAYLARAGETSDVLADRAALALTNGDARGALVLCDAALAIKPDLAPALWNRGLALRDLGLTRGAAAMFKAVADRHEHGWAEEATKRAAALDAEADALAKRFDRLNHASVALASGKLEMSVDDARAEPGYARGILYDAIRSAPDAARLDALRPLADAIDATDHDTAVTDAITRAKASLNPAFANKYAAMIRTLSVRDQLTPAVGDEAPLPTGEARTKWLADLRAAHADDLLLGVMMKLASDGDTVDDGELAEFSKLAAASPDPWMQMLGLQQQAQAALRKDDLVGAEAVLLRARTRCLQGAPAFRCTLVEEHLVDLYLKWLRLPDARTALAAAWALAMRSGEWFLQTDLLSRFTRLYVVDADADGSDLSLVRAYSDEVTRQAPNTGDWECQDAAWARVWRAQVLVNRLDFAAARRELAGPRCVSAGEPAHAAQQLFLRAELASEPGAPDDIAPLRADIAALRADKTTALEQQIILEHAEGRLLVGRDPAAGEALLRHAIAMAQQLPTSAVEARRTVAWSYALLAIAAAKRNDATGALAVLAEEQELSPLASCALGIAIDDRSRAVIALDAAGKPLIHVDDGRTSTKIEPGALVPAELVHAFGGCREVSVIARAPVHGTSRLLPDDMAWRYVSRRAGAARPPGTRDLVIADVEPPAALRLPHLQTWPGKGDVLAGVQATPANVLAAMGNAGEVVVHAHGVVDAAQTDASYLALSPEASGKFALTTADVHAAHFVTSPLIVLAACEASQAAPVLHEAWSLPAAFVYAGARAVLASTAPIPDAEAAAFFDDVRARIHAGADTAVALRDARTHWLADHHTDWVRDVIVFE